MAVITGSSGNDTLIGAADDDVLQSLGGTDYLSGGAGADEYQVYQTAGATRVTIEDLGGDGGVDTITGGRGLYASANLGYSAWATAERVGDDLVLVLPGKPHEFRKPGYGAATLDILDHFAGEAVEYLVAGGVTYRLAISSAGSLENDIMGGTSGADVFTGGGGDDFLDGNGGDDRLDGGAGGDTVFGDSGRDTIETGDGDDRAYGGTGRDSVNAGAGQDFLYLGDASDTARGGEGADIIHGDAGNDRLYGDAGQDLLSGDAGNDRLFGGLDGDTYRLGYDRDALAGIGAWGHDTINDAGEAVAAYDNYDRIELFGFYGPADGSGPEAYARLSFARVGRDMIVTADDGASTIEVMNQFHERTAKFAIEELEFNAGYWSPLYFKILDGQRVNIGDDRRYPNGIGGEYNEILFGTDADDQAFGNSGTNFIWLGAGQDTLIYKECDPENFGGYGGSIVNDIVMDFDITQDRLDFTEIKGLVFSDLAITSDPDGGARIYWDSGTIEVADITIELRGVDAASLTVDLFDFL